MVRKRWFWVSLIALAVLLVPALVWSQRRPPAPAVKERSAPPAPAAEGSDLQAGDADQEAGQAESRLYMVDGHLAGLAVVDGASGEVLRALNRAVLAPDASRLYQVRQMAGQTYVQAVDPETGQAAGEIAFEGLYDLPWIGSQPAGLAPGGRWLVLQSLRWWDKESKDQGSHFAMVDLSFDAPPRMVDLEGRFEFDALSDDGLRLYLTEYLGGPSLARYRVRLYDLAAGRLDPAVIADKTEGEEEMAGYRQAAVASPDGRWLYSLYLKPHTSAPFVHALNVAEGWAACIDLPVPKTRQGIEPSLWGLALAPGGGALYAVNGAGGMAVEIDTAGLSVRRSVELDSSQAGGGPLARLLGLLAPAAQAKIIAVNPVVIAPDGGRLYALGSTGLVAVDTADLAVRGEYLAEYRLSSLAVSPDGTALYAVSPEPGRVLRLDPATGEIVGTMESKGFWPGILAVTGATPPPVGEVGGRVPDACPVTRPQEPAFVPPPPYDTLAGDPGSFWYGSEELWTSLLAGGIWRDLPHGPRGYTQKTVWWQPGYDWQEEPEPDLVVTGRRLLGDGPASALRASRGTNGFHRDYGSFMLAGIQIPEAGCWEITGRIDGQELSYVVWVAP